MNGSRGSGEGLSPPGMEPLLLGYFPKRLVPPPAWMLHRGIEEIASVSLCIADGPDRWLEAWKHNEWGFFPSPEAAWSLVSEERRREFRLYAYQLYPLRFSDGAKAPMRVDRPDVVPLGDEFASVGWDVASRSTGHYFECSPLSCNLLAKELPTNRFCLFGDLGAALEVARTADQRRCEPGPYHVLEVWRRRPVADKVSARGALDSHGIAPEGLSGSSRPFGST